MAVTPVCYPRDLVYVSFRETAIQIQNAQKLSSESAKVFEHFLLKDVRILQKIDFNIKDITAISKAEPDTRPGLAPDWGTDIFEAMSFKDLTFEDCNFKFLNFSKAIFKDVKFIRCCFEGTIFDEATLERVDFEECQMVDSSFSKAVVSKVCFIRNIAWYANFTDAAFRNVSFFFNDLHGCNFYGSSADSFSIEGDIQNVLLYGRKDDVNREMDLNKPVVLVSWDNKNPGLAAAKIVKKIQELGGIPFKFNYKDVDIDPIKLKLETDHIFERIYFDRDNSLAKKLLDFAKHRDFPEISKIQKKAQSWIDAVSGALNPTCPLHP